MNPLQRARWQLAVLGELAHPAFMRLAPVLDESREVQDFVWSDASPTSMQAFGCAGEDLVGRSLMEVLTECGIDLLILAACQSAFREQCSRVEHVKGKDGLALHQISPSPWEVTIKITSQAAVERVLSAERLIRQLESSDRHCTPSACLRTSTPWSPGR